MTIFALAHIAAGTLAVLTGLIALFAQKGGKLHRRAGRVFVGTMILTAGGGALYAFDRPEALTAIIGFFTCYLVLSSLHTVWPRGRHARVLDYFTLLAALLLAATFFGFGAKAPPIEPEFGITPAAFYVFGGLALMAAAGDLVNCIKRGLKGRWRIARHLWRMGFALHIAAGSLFDGPGTSIFPESLQGSRWLTVPVDAIALMVLMWFALVLLKNTSFLLGRTSRRRKNTGAAAPTTSTNALGDAQ